MGENLEEYCRKDIKRILMEEPKERWTDFDDFKEDLLKGFDRDESKLRRVYEKVINEFRFEFINR